MTKGSSGVIAILHRVQGGASIARLAGLIFLQRRVQDCKIEFLPDGSALSDTQHYFVDVAES